MGTCKTPENLTSGTQGGIGRSSTPLIVELMGDIRKGFTLDSRSCIKIQSQVARAKTARYICQKNKKQFKIAIRGFG